MGGGVQKSKASYVPTPTPSLFGTSEYMFEWCLSASLNIHNSNIRETRLYIKFPDLKRKFENFRPL